MGIEPTRLAVYTTDIARTSSSLSLAQTSSFRVTEKKRVTWYVNDPEWLPAGVGLCWLLLASCASAGPPAASRAPSATRQRRSDDYDNMDNFLMGAGDYDNFFLKTAKSVPRIGRRSEPRGDDQVPVRMTIFVLYLVFLLFKALDLLV